MKEGILMEQEAMEAAAAGVSAGSMVVSLIISIIVLVAMWKIFTKAGEAGWKSIIPFLNLYVLFKIAWGNGWLFLLMLIPIVDIVVMFIVYWKMSKAFGCGVGMFLLMLFLPYIGLPILGFGKASYIGPQ